MPNPIRWNPRVSDDGDGQYEWPAELSTCAKPTGLNVLDTFDPSLEPSIPTTNRLWGMNQIIYENNRQMYFNAGPYKTGGSSWFPEERQRYYDNIMYPSHVTSYSNGKYPNSPSGPPRVFKPGFYPPISDSYLNEPLNSIRSCQLPPIDMPLPDGKNPQNCVYNFFQRPMLANIIKQLRQHIDFKTSAEQFPAYDWPPLPSGNTKDAIFRREIFHLRKALSRPYFYIYMTNLYNYTFTQHTKAWNPYFPDWNPFWNEQSVMCPGMTLYRCGAIDFKVLQNECMGCTGEAIDTFQYGTGQNMDGISSILDYGKVDHASPTTIYFECGVSRGIYNYYLWPSYMTAALPTQIDLPVYIYNWNISCNTFMNWRANSRFWPIDITYLETYWKMDLNECKYTNWPEYHLRIGRIDSPVYFDVEKGQGGESEFWTTASLNNTAFYKPMLMEIMFSFQSSQERIQKGGTDGRLKPSNVIDYPQNYWDPAVILHQENATLKPFWLKMTY